MSERIKVIGAGLAGSEAAYRLAESGLKVTLIEMRPGKKTEAHQTGFFAELVCSNSLKAMNTDSPQGHLKAELEMTGSLIMQAAHATALPAGLALAVDRERFAKYITDKLTNHKNIKIIFKEQKELCDDETTIIATGPLTSVPLANEIAALTGRDALYFYDAISPIVDADSINMDRAFKASRYDKGGDDYINCPMSKSEYTAFRNALLNADKVTPHRFEEPRYFEGCLPLEVIAERGEETLAFGPFKPVGLIDPKTGGQPYCVLQLRAENLNATAWSLVACQTRLTYPEQKRVLKMIPALENAKFLRHGSIHRNTYMNSPVILGYSLELRSKKNIRFAGQITGIEGYLESVAMGFWAAEALIQEKRSGLVIAPPKESAIGALLNYVLNGAPRSAGFTPMNANLSIFPPLEKKAPKRERKKAVSMRGIEAFKKYLEETKRR